MSGKKKKDRVLSTRKLQKLSEDLADLAEDCRRLAQEVDRLVEARNEPAPEWERDGKQED
ncbi:hypothetical protein [Anthocerotibacter panamensis]|uniref:hypothetical protein n=1 Tax=Anthocerotibacter panamensis TaxID=2857077 RepID=UPI001C401C42|nr:hypothetical protein [Anthocerotibacter panamensis]